MAQGTTALLLLVAVTAVSAQLLDSEFLSDEQLRQLKSRPDGVDVAFDCAARNFTFEFASKLQGWRGQTAMQQVHDSLELSTLCNISFDASQFQPSPKAPTIAIADDVQVHVNPTLGNDATGLVNGKASPFLTVHAAVAAVRRYRNTTTQPCRQPSCPSVTVILHPGKHRMLETLHLDARDSYMTFVNTPGEESVMTGAKAIQPNWQPYKVDDNNNIYVADLSNQGITRIEGLRVSGRRGNPASYPNRDPETTLFPDGWVANKNTKWRAPATPKTEPVYFQLPEPYLKDKTLFQNYAVGVNGTCEIYDPPVSYWCYDHPSGGGAFTFRLPSGMQLPHDEPIKQWANPKGAHLAVWRPAHWASWFFEVESVNASGFLEWSKGGFQGARGSDNGAEWYIANVFEELDAPQEYFFNATEQKLYFFYNGTGPPSSDLEFEVVLQDTLVSLKSEPSSLVTGINFKGITFRDAAYTYLKPHGVPSGGDWGLQRMGAVFLEGTEEIVIEQCLFTRLDGNAIMISGRNRNVNITHNEFVWIGDSVMAAWGYTAPLNKGGDDFLAQYRAGIDARNGEQPRGISVIQNLIHELGHFEKQSSPWFQAKSAQNLIQQNVYFNMPRAGVNFNDGLGGGHVFKENAGWNTCRESSDHAVFNSWDRQPFLTNIGQTPGTADLNPAYNHLERNLQLGNYGANMAIDNDDGSSFYYILNNFEIYGGHKSDFGGHNKIRHGAINAFARVYNEGLCARINTVMVEGYLDAYYNNTCIQSASELPAYDLSYCDPSNPSNVSTMGIMHDNRIYNPNGTMTLSCGKTTLTEGDFQKTGADPGTTVHQTPPYSEIIQWARDMLQMVPIPPSNGK
eukprot:TRINITY_DN12600_c1_g2_i8.p1 TRINITY_DN12600_c1_g2~~TRINITY_DN12600_c1_g2_i8.p1  ORF type:complete len:851 (+),score=193.92 TRINITY_DN12600_c1_g2_i8:2-2554(+)